ncbi:MAG: hypothetical protein ABJL67_15765 [Sulfitobacter sp.]
MKADERRHGKATSDAPKRMFRRVEYDKMTKRARILFCYKSKPGADEIEYFHAAEITALNARIASLEKQVTQARNRALDEAARLCWKQRNRRRDQCSFNVSDIQRARWVAGAMESERLAEAIRSLKETPNDR